MAEENRKNPYALVIGADLPLSESESTIKNLLESLREARKFRHDLKLLLAGRRTSSDRYSIWNYLEENELTDAVEFIPYYDVCASFPILKRDCDLWIEKDTPASALTPEAIIDAFIHPPACRNKLALFVTGFHPRRNQGNSAYARFWLDHLRQAGYRVHVLYYGVDLDQTSMEMRLAALRAYDLYLEVKVTSASVGRNENGLYAHVDDWCGSELLDRVDSMTRRFQYDIAVVNYAFLSATFDRLPNYTEKVLLTHNRFADRNRRILAQGYPESSWISLDEQGERLACLRADTVIAVQGQEASYFSRLVEDKRKVCVVSPVFPIRKMIRRRPSGKLRVGFMGSSNLANETNIYEFLKIWVNRPILTEGSSIVIAGGVCETLPKWIAGAAELLDRIKPKMLGEVERPEVFFRQCDVVINPEIGGTGLKIKTVEAMAHGTALLTTCAGAIGTGSSSRFHQASTLGDLADLCELVLEERDLLNQVKYETILAYKNYVKRNHVAMAQVLGAQPAGKVAGKVRRLIGVPGVEVVEPLVSIIVPVFKVEEFLEECLESVINQDYENIEVLVVDDASPDNSREIAEFFAMNDPRVRVITHERNLGLGPARNTGERHARGEFIFFLDSDDYLLSFDAISELVKSAGHSECEIVVGSCAKLLPDGSLQPYDNEFDKRAANLTGAIISGADAFAAGLFLPTPNYLPLRAWGMLISRPFYQRMALDFPSGEHEDMVHTPFLYAGANGVLYLRDPIIAYRVREGSISNMPWTTPMVERYFQLWRRMAKNLERFALQDYREQAALKIVEHLFWKLQANGFEPACASAALKVAKAIADDGGANQSNELWFSIIEMGRSIFLDEKLEFDAYAAFARTIPSGVLLTYYERRMNSN